MSKLKFTCNDIPNERTVKFSTTLSGESIYHYVDAFRQFLLALEFSPDTINKVVGEHSDVV